MYIGPVERQAVETWVWKDGGMSLEEVTYSPGLAQIFLEVLTNAVDHSMRERVSEIRVSIDEGSGEISVWNDGPGIVCSKTGEGIPGPELVFGHFLSGSNFDDSGEGRVVAGTHGIGAKATNAFSRVFRVETVDASSKKRVVYSQEWRDNMAVVSAPDVAPAPAGTRPYTRVTFSPDYERFGGGLDADTVSVMSRYVVDACAATPARTSVWLNGTRVDCRGFKEYCSMYSPGVVLDTACDGGLSVAVAASPDGVFRQVSMVNGLATPRGGRHVEHVASALAKRIASRLSSKSREVPPRSARSAMWVFVSCTVPNPTFDSQNKQTLTTPADKLGFRYEPSDAFVRAILSRTAVRDIVDRLGAADDSSRLKKTDGSRRRVVTGIPNFDDAHAAGTGEGRRCTLILTEGLSARSTVVAGLAAVGRKYHGVMALKGKPLNPRDASAAKIRENAEIANLKKAVGLESGRSYDTDEDFDSLRYGSIALACDADGDGDHICALVCNIFHCLWPSLLRRPGFLSSIRTPVVVARRGKERKVFYHMLDFERWQESASDARRGWSSTFYKGLGLISSEDAREYFGNPRLYRFTCAPPPTASPESVFARLAVVGDSVSVTLRCGRAIPDGDDDAMDLAFRRSRSEDRKVWLNEFDRRGQLPPDAETVSVCDFVRLQLCHYSWDDVQRSLPHAVDGLKESTRKILFAVKKRAASAGHIRVAQMAAYAGQVSSYRHGEASLTGAIVGMAQDFVGCGHVQLIHGEGQFGTRIVGGKDAASSRYIHCDIGRLANVLFPPEDEPVLARNIDDDRNPIEPEFYVPVLPLLLLNGSVGIGTGWNSSFPCFSPLAVAAAYKRRLNGDTLAFSDALLAPPPCYKGFRGTFALLDNKWVSRGTWILSGKTIRVTELPVGSWLSDYKVFLESLCADNTIGLRRVESNYTDTAADFLLHFDSASSAAACSPLVDLRLESDKNLSTQHMNAISHSGGVRRFLSPADIAEEHYTVRHATYSSRLDHLRRVASSDLDVANARLDFVRSVVSRDLDISTMTEADIAAAAESRRWPLVSGSLEYLVGMPISSLTPARVARLQADADSKSRRLEHFLSATVEGEWAREIEALLDAMEGR